MTPQQGQNSAMAEGLERAEQAIACLTKNDVAELRSFSKPPAAVVMVMKAVMLLLTGEIMDWKGAKRVMSNGERFLQMMGACIRDRERLPAGRMQKLRQKFTNNPNFHPDCVEPISRGAARFCAWVLGVVQFYSWSTGTAHPRVDPLRPYSAPGESGVEGDSSILFPPVHESGSLANVYGTTTASGLNRDKRGRIDTSPLRSRPGQDENDDIDAELTAYDSGMMFNDRAKSPIMPHGMPPTRERSLSPMNTAFGRHSSLTSAMSPVRTGGKVRTVDEFEEVGQADLTIQRKPKLKLTKKQKRARAKIQARQMQRLASGGDDTANDTGNSESTETGNSFTCSDGTTMIPYEVMGTQELEGKNNNFVVMHDFFDTYESIQIFFQRLVKKYVGCQVLILNTPGQGETRWGSTGPTAAEKKHGGGRDTVVNNQFCADCLHELLQHVESTGEFTCSIQKFYLMGIGNGGAIATNFACRYGKSRDYAPTFKSLVLFNGFAFVDNQLAAILHSSVNVFSCFPQSRPDLPISYFTRFLFSDAYLQKVDPNLVLNIYTAIANKITLEGRIAICKGALRHVDMRPQLKNIKVPIVILQSTENVLIAPTNVDPFLEGRSVMHLWSHQHTGSGISSRAHSQLRECLTRSGGRTAFVMWLRAGHEVRQESKTAVLDLLGRLADPSSTVPVESIEEPLEIQDKKGRKKKRKKKKSAKEEVDPYAEDPIYEQKRDLGSVMESKEEEDAAEIGNEETSVDLLSATVPNRKPVDEQKSAGRKVDLSTTAPAAFGKFDEQKEEKHQTKFEANLVEQRRKERLQETDREFEEAMRKHKQSINGTFVGKTNAIADSNRLLEETDKAISQNRYESKYDQTVEEDGDDEVKNIERQFQREEKEKKKLGGLDAGISTQPTLGHGFRTLEEEKQELQRKLKEYEDQRIKRRKKEEEEMQQALIDLKRDTKTRRDQFHKQDEEKLQSLEKELEERRKKREEEDVRRRAELNKWESDIVARHKAEADAMLVSEAKEKAQEDELERKREDMMMTPAERLKKEKAEEEKLRRKYEVQMIMAQTEQAVGGGMTDMFSDMAKQDEEMKRMGIMKMDEYERVKSDLVMAEVRRKEMEEAMSKGAAFEREHAAAIVIQAGARGMFGRIKASKRRHQLETEALREISAIKMQSVARGHLGRKKAKAMRYALHRARMERTASVKIQKCFRGLKGRRKAQAIRERRAATRIQKVYRGHLGRLIAEVERQRLARIQLENDCATKLQATFRMYKGRMEFIDRRVREVAAVQVQRIWRGLRGRRKAARKRKWDSTAPGPDRLKLGLTLIEETKEAFQTQQEEINALHRAQERSEARVSEIHEGLKESEEELRVLERELADIDQLDRDLHELTHERAMLEAKAQDSEEQAAVALQELEAGEIGGAAPGTGQSGGLSKLDPAARRAAAKKAKKEARERAAEAYALEMAIHLKRAERERKKKELEAEFAGVFAEVEKKKNELARLENRIADMEATRKRKDREFVRLQRNLMELLEEQKVELDSLREKGIELETATATSAAAAAATAHAAKENERRSRAMFENTEELMKFQFMSMSLSYFSSLNMLKSLRDINADTTSAAVSSSAQTAAAAAAAAAAANIPELKHLKMGTEDLLDASTKKKQQEIIEQKRKAAEQRELLSQPFPEDVADWTVTDVSRWLDTISLSQYKRAFTEASVDGQFLTELRNEDLRDVLGVEHELHRKKIGVMIEKLKPLDKREVFMRDTVLKEEGATEQRQDTIKKESMPTTDSVFSMCRNGRYKRLEAALDLGFPVDTVDEHGNTLLSVSCQQVNQRVCEMLLDRRANINHQNNLGNTPLHYAMAYEPEGVLGEYLIGRGSDDMIENNEGLTPYDGIE
jgi:alpha-beta hydrolase superfamily lysophospholipase